jgi:hypothetical protein
MTVDDEFTARINAVLTRFAIQNRETPPTSEVCRVFASRLWSVVAERGLPRPLAPHERGEPGGMSEEECAPLVSSVAGAGAPLLLVDAARQLVKTCLYPEFKTCRDSFREIASDGSCRRQELDRARRRVSGTHCVDCPHWVALTPSQHEKFLERQWRAGASEFIAGRAIFLPEDFRALRKWLRAAARKNYPRGENEKRSGTA